MVLVTGATGLVGTHLLVHLVNEDQPIRALYRTEDKRLFTKKIILEHLIEEEKHEVTEAETLFNKIEWVQTSLEDISGLQQAFSGAKLVYHCAALISYDVADYKLLRKTNIEGTANIVNLCIQNKVQKLCYVSSIATLGSPTDESSKIDESTEWNQEALNSVYAITKYGAELEVWRASQEGLDVVIVNPGVIIGKGSYKCGSGVIYSRVHNGISYYTKGGTGFVGAGDVVKSMIKLVKSPIRNERFVLVAESLSYQNSLSKIALALGKKPPKKEAEPWMVNTYRIIRWIGSILFGMKSDFSKALTRSLFTTSLYDATKIKTALNFEFEPVDDVITKTATHFLKNKNS